MSSYTAVSMVGVRLRIHKYSRLWDTDHRIALKWNISTTEIVHFALWAVKRKNLD